MTKYKQYFPNNDTIFLIVDALIPNEFVISVVPNRYVAVHSKMDEHWRFERVCVGGRRAQYRDIVNFGVAYRVCRLGEVA